ncbi:hypothetical protein LINPERHAP1_LOCUS6031 [Linum perenne]
MESSIDRIISQTSLFSCVEPIVELTREGDRLVGMAQKSLIGRFVGDREFSVTTIKNNAQRVWKLKGDPKVWKIQHVFVFTFFEYNDKKKVEKGNPWMILQSHLIGKSVGGILEFKRPPEVPWCLIGNFNVLRVQEEKQGRASAALRRMQLLNDAILHWEVLGIKSARDPFT